MKLATALLVGVATLGLFPLTEASSAAPSDQTRPRFVPPQRDMVLTRTLVRELSDGQQIVVTRRFRIHFQANSAGFEIVGSQIAVEVDAPSKLASMADLERQRIERGAFPLQLNADGIVVDQRGQPIDPMFNQEMTSRASALLSVPQASADERAANNRALGTLNRQGGNTPWPADLFSAAPGERHQERDLTLSDGRLGKIEVVLKVGSPLACGLPQSFERVVITQLPGSRMVSREIFTFADLAE